MIRVPVRRGRQVVAFALVDDQDGPLVLSRTWRLSYGYAITSISQTQNLFMHRMLTEAPEGMTVDHINRDKLDNRRANLRLCTQAENTQNAGHRSGTSKYRGVSWDRTRNKWQAQVHLNGRCHHLGRFQDEEQAAAVASAFRAEHMPFSEDALAARAAASTDLVSESTERKAA